MHVSTGAHHNQIGTDGDGIGDLDERNIISGNGGIGIAFTDPGTTGNIVAGNFIGTDVTGSADFGNGREGVLIASGAAANRIGTNGDGTGDDREGNVISGNGQQGVFIVGGGTDENVVAGNIIGLTAAGDRALGNAANGVAVIAGAGKNRIGTDGDGIADAAERNIISANGHEGVHLAGGSTDGNVVAGNYIGTDRTGSRPFGNGRHGVAVFSGASSNRIGVLGDGTGDAAERNVISGNHFAGIGIAGLGTENNVVAGNLIGVTADGDTRLANLRQGVVIDGSARSNRVGTNGDGVADAQERNIDSGNADVGIKIAGGSRENLVAGNYIGIDELGRIAISNSAHGVHIFAGASDNRLVGNLISGNAQDGVRILHVGTSRNVLEGNLIGTDSTGMSTLGNGLSGVRIFVGASANRVENNVISGNAGDGVQISDIGTNANVIAGNFIGVDATGQRDLGNGATGVIVRAGAQSNVIGTDGDGQADVAERNVIAGNQSVGVQISGSGTEGNVLAGNLIGTDLSGAAALPNATHGVRIAGGARQNLIGTDGDGVADAAERNVISGNTFYGVEIAGADENVVAGNFIGTAVSGTVALSNGWDGVFIGNGARSNLVGTDADGVADAAERNVISGNTRNGIWILAAGTERNRIAGNDIGVDVTGTIALGNGHNGVLIQSGAQANVIGTNGDGAGDTAERNVIAGNHHRGVFLSNAGSGNSIRGNSIHSNSGLGIDLGSIGQTSNDAGDGDTGPNDLQNFPVVEHVIPVGPNTTIVGHINSTPTTTLRIDFYANASADPSGHGEGERWLGYLDVTTDDAGNARFTVVMPVSVGFDDWVTATATAFVGGTLSSTSEFSTAVLANRPPTAHVGGPYTLPEGGSIQLDASGSSDPDQGAALRYEWDFDYDGVTFSADASGVRPVLDASLLDGPATRAVAVRVSDEGGLSDVSTATVTIENAPPTAGITGPAQGYAGDTLAFVLSGTDPSPADASAGFTFAIDWNGDGDFDQAVNPGDSLLVDHTFSQAGSFTIRVTATDRDGGTSAIATHDVVVIQPVQIDVRDTVSLNGQGMLAVAIFTTSDFDASRVDAGTVLFANALVASHAFEDVDGDGDLDLVLNFRIQDTNLQAVYEQLLADDLNEDGVLDSKQQEAEVVLTGQTLDQVFIEGGDQLNLFLSGKALRDLLEDMAGQGMI
jgi:titin